MEVKYVVYTTIQDGGYPVLVKREDPQGEGNRVLHLVTVTHLWGVECHPSGGLFG